MQSIIPILMFVVLVCVGELAMCRPPLQGGDRMVFIGDSITQQRIYTRYVMNYFAMRYPGSDISFRNAGWNGDTASGGLARIHRDVLSLKPTAVSICYGMNDAYPSPPEFAEGKTQFDQAKLERFIRAQKGLLAELKKAGVKVILLTPGCVDPDQNKSLAFYNDTLEKFAEAVKQLAAEESVPVYDIHALMRDAQLKGKADHKDFTIIPDSVHPTNPGHAIMAYGLLKAMGANDEPSELWIDTVSHAVVPDRCTVTDLSVTKNSVSFVRTDDALPTYFDPDCSAVYRYLPIMQDLNQYRFRVTGLGAGIWKLTVQGIETGSFSSDALEEGIDLAASPGPWQELGKDINRMSTEQENAYFNRWREVGACSVPEQAQPQFDTLLEKLDQLIADQESARTQAVLNNRTWTWSLILEK